MSNLFGTMRASLTALETIQESIAVSQNNVTNASVPGYARQRLSLKALEFNPETGMAGGVTSGGMISTRDEYLELTVRAEVTALAESEAMLSSMTSLEGVLNLNDNSGIAPSLDRLFTAFNAWSVTPNSTGAKENVHAAAADVARAFRQTASALEGLAQRGQERLETDVREINSLAEYVRQYNVARRSGSGRDAGVEATLNETLEQLSALVDIHVLWQPDGTVNVLAGGQAGLVVGDHREELRVSYYGTDPAPANPDALPAAHIATASGLEITDAITGGKLAAGLRFRNQTLPSLLGSTQEPGELNKLARAVADRINSILASGYPPPHEPYHLFVYGTSAVSIAHTIEVNPTLAPALLNATDPLQIPPTVNGKALQLAELGHPSDPADMLDGMSYVAYFGKMSADAGRRVAALKQETDSRKQLTAQARNMRAQAEGVSFDEEAVQLVQLQRAYQATSRMISTVDELLEIVLNIGR